MSIELLQNSYLEAKRTLIPFARQIRGENNDNQGKNSLKLSEIASLFTNSQTWQEKKTRSGHRKFEHPITHAIVEFKAHGNNNFDKGAALTILDAVQEHLNILNNQILWNNNKRNWNNQEPPDFEAALQRLQNR